MLIRFTVENFLSFNGPVEFSMYPGPATSHKNHKYIEDKYNGINVLKLSLIYGANASGKSNLVKALDFAKKFILKGYDKNKPIKYNEFKFDLESINKPSKFEFEIKINNKNYSYGFQFNKEVVLEEWLCEITKNNEKTIFYRITTDNGEVILNNSPEFTNKNDEQYFLFTSKATNTNKLFLTEYNDKNIDLQKPLNDVFEWFSEKLTIIHPDIKYGGLRFSLLHKKAEKEYITLLKHFDTGIDSFTLENSNKGIYELSIPKQIIDKTVDRMKPNTSALIESTDTNEFYLLSMDEDRNIIANKLKTKHKIKNSKENCLLEINQESDGTQRMMDLIPALIMLLSSDAVIVIDELDRSLHPSISSQFIKIFSDFTKGRPSQLICTTHDSNLLNLDNLRRDEIWFMEKNKYGESKLYSLEEFKIRRDMDIRKGYLLGRFGGIPYEQNIDNLKELING